MSSELNEYIAWTKFVGLVSLKYVSPVIHSIGLLLNSISFVVLMRKSLRQTTFSFNNMFIFGAETVSLIAGAIGFLLPYYGFSLELYATPICALSSFVRQLATGTAIWIQIWMLLESYLSIRFIRRFQMIHTRRASLIVVLLILAFVSVLNATNLTKSVRIIATRNDNATNQTLIVSAECNTDYVINFAQSLVDIFIGRFILPTTIMMTLNFLIIRKLFETQAKSRRTSRADKANNNLPSRKQLSFAFSLLVGNLFYLTTHLPVLISVFILNLFQYAPSLGATPYRMSQIVMVLNILRNSVAIDFSFLFFVYLFTNKLFYRSFMCLIGRATANDESTRINASKSNPKIESRTN